MVPPFFACKKYIITWRWSAFIGQKRFMIMSKGITSKMGLRTIHMILKLSVIALIIFGTFWIGLIITYPDVEFLRNVPFGGISFLLALIIFPVYLRVRWLTTSITQLIKTDIHLGIYLGNDFVKYWRILSVINIGAATYIPRLSAITEIPSPSTSASEPSSARAIIDNVEIIGVMNALTASWNKGFSLSMSAIEGANE